MSTTPATDANTLVVAPPTGPVATAAATGLAPVADADKPLLDEQARTITDLLVNGTPDQTDALIASYGATESTAVKDAGARLASRPGRTLSTFTDRTNPVLVATDKIRDRLNDLNPATALAPRKVLGLFTRKPDPAAYLAQYAAARDDITAYATDIGKGRTQLLKDNATLRAERATLWDGIENLSKSVYTLNQAITNSDGHANPDTLHRARQRHHDLLEQLAVAIQSYLAADVVIRLNDELARGAARAETLTTAVVDAALLAASVDAATDPTSGAGRVADAHREAIAALNAVTEYTSGASESLTVTNRNLTH